MHMKATYIYMGPLSSLVFRISQREEIGHCDMPSPLETLNPFLLVWYSSTADLRIRSRFQWAIVSLSLVNFHPLNIRGFRNFSYVSGKPVDIPTPLSYTMVLLWVLLYCSLTSLQILDLKHKINVGWRLLNTFAIENGILSYYNSYNCLEYFLISSRIVAVDIKPLLNGGCCLPHTLRIMSWKRV